MSDQQREGCRASSTDDLRHSDRRLNCGLAGRQDRAGYRLWPRCRHLHQHHQRLIRNWLFPDGDSHRRGIIAAIISATVGAPSAAPILRLVIAAAAGEGSRRNPLRIRRPRAGWRCKQEESSLTRKRTATAASFDRGASPCSGPAERDRTRHAHGRADLGRHDRIDAILCGASCAAKARVKLATPPLAAGRQRRGFDR